MRKMKCQLEQFLAIIRDVFRASNLVPSAFMHTLAGICLSVYLYLSLSVCLSVCPSLSVNQSVKTHLYSAIFYVGNESEVCVSVSACLSVCLLVSMEAESAPVFMISDVMGYGLDLCLSLCLSLCLYVCLSVLGMYWIAVFKIQLEPESTRYQTNYRPEPDVCNSLKPS